MRWAGCKIAIKALADSATRESGENLARRLCVAILYVFCKRYDKITKFFAVLRNVALCRVFAPVFALAFVSARVLA